MAKGAFALKIFQGRRAEPLKSVDTRDIGGPSMYYARTAFNFVIPEYVQELYGREGIRTYDKMRRSSVHVKASLKLVKAPVLTADWNIKPASDSVLDREVAQFVRFNLFEWMERPFLSLVREALGMLDFGFYPFELLWGIDEYRPQATDEQPKPRPRTVARLLDIAPRHPIAVYQITRDEHGRLDFILYGSLTSKLEVPKLVIFTLDEEGNDPTGTSVLRSAYQNWWYLQQFYKIDAIQKERHGIGIPRVTLPPGHNQRDIELANEIGENLRTNERAHITQFPNWVIDFLELHGNMVDVLKSAEHHAHSILLNVLGQFLDMTGGRGGSGGSSQSGSRSTGSVGNETYMQSILYVIDNLAETINQKIIKQLVDFNYEVTAYPKLQARQIDETKLRALSVALRNMIVSQVITPDPPLEEFARDFMQLPDASPEALARTATDRAMATKTANSVAMSEEGGGE